MKIPLHLQFRKSEIEITYIYIWIGYIYSTYKGFLGFSWIYQTARFDPVNGNSGFLLK
jgi:hypothetical protein